MLIPAAFVLFHQTRALDFCASLTQVTVLSKYRILYLQTLTERNFHNVQWCSTTVLTCLVILHFRVRNHMGQICAHNGRPKPCVYSIICATYFGNPSWVGTRPRSTLFGHATVSQAYVCLSTVSVINIVSHKHSVSSRLLKYLTLTFVDLRIQQVRLNWMFIDHQCLVSQRMMFECLSVFKIYG